MKALIKLHIDFGRQGNISGLFLADTREIKKIIKDKQRLYFGEALGKHSEISCILSHEDYTVVTINESDISDIERIFGDDPCLSGYYIFDYISDEES